METPVYIKIDEFDSVMSALKEIKQKTITAREKLEEIKSVSQQEAMAVKEWEERVGRIEHNLDEMHAFLNSKDR